MRRFFLALTPAPPIAARARCDIRSRQELRHNSVYPWIYRRPLSWAGRGVGEEPAVDVDLRAREIGRLIRSEQNGDRGDLLGKPEALERGVFHERRHAALTLPARAQHFLQRKFKPDPRRKPASLDGFAAMADAVAGDERAEHVEDHAAGQLRRVVVHVVGRRDLDDFHAAKPFLRDGADHL